jgi:hypothetical protein
MPCMFCGSDNNLTSEHAFPAFMGGELEVPDGSCSCCNGQFATWEGEIKKETALLLHLLQIENRYGIVPNAKVAVTVRDMDVEGLVGLREPDGTIRLQDKVQESVKSDGKKHRHGFFVSNESAERFLQRARARGEKTAEMPVPKDVVYDASLQLTLGFAKSLETRKVIAKIALASLAYQSGLSYALSHQFDRLRQVRTDADLTEFPVSIFANESFMGAHVRTIHQHSVICYLSAGQHKGWAVVTIFGGLTYAVQVTENYQESSSRQFSIFYGAATKKQISPVLLANEMSLVRMALSKESIYEDKQAIDVQWSPLLEAYCADVGVQLERIPPERPAV